MNISLELYNNSVDYDWWNSDVFHSFTEAQAKIDEYVSKLPSNKTQEYTWRANLPTHIIEGSIVLWNSPNAGSDNSLFKAIIQTVWYEIEFYITSADKRQKLRELMTALITDYKEIDPLFDATTFEHEQAA